MVAKISGSGEPRSIIESRHSAGPSFTRSEDLEPDNSRWSIELFVVVIIVFLIVLDFSWC